MVAWIERHRVELERWSSQSAVLSRLVVSYRALIRSGLLTPKAAVTTAIVGVAVFVPLFTLFVFVARRVEEAL